MNINKDTIIMGLIGYPLGHSLSPLMQNRVIEKLLLNAVYIPFEVKPGMLETAVDAVRALNIRGVNVTIPYKEAVIPYLDELSDEARACGAVNLIKNEEGCLIGCNTDGKGFLASLREEGVKPEGHVLFIGAGGAARAVAYELSLAGAAHMSFLDLNRERAQELADFVREQAQCSASGEMMNEEEFLKISPKADIIINCSPVGMYPHIDKSPVDSLDSLSSDAVICDLVYNPVQTRLLKIADERGLKTVPGLSMLVNQGALTLEILSGKKAPVSFMKEVVRNYFTEQERLYSD